MEQSPIDKSELIMEVKDLCQRYLDLCERKEQLSFLYNYSKDETILENLKRISFEMYRVEIELKKG